jgi:hypothetical protein
MIIENNKKIQAVNFITMNLYGVESLSYIENLFKEPFKFEQKDH